ncbi:MAG: DUF1572 family protein [Bacteroidia bacterium]
MQAVFNSSSFKSISVAHLNEYMLRIKKAIADLNHEQIWWKPHPNTISIGNILKHLNGNVTQWMISGLGREEDHRNRAEEFKDDEMPAKEILLNKLSLTISKSCNVIENISDDDLQTSITIQDFETTKLAAIYHVVEHFSWHSGQVTWVSKMLQGENHHIAFYDDNKLNEAKNK